MSTSNNTLRVTELDFDSIKNNLKTFLRSQSEFTDYDFEGSGMSVLLDVLAYNTHYMGYYLNMVANEMFLDTAQLRSSVLSHAKLINYIPESRKGAEAIITINVTPSVTEDTTSTIATLNKYTKFVAADNDGQNYQFVTTDAYTATKLSNKFTFANVSIRQGEVVTLQFPVDTSNPKRRFTLPSANIDTDTLVVTVQASASSTDTEIYTLATDVTELTSSSPVYFIEENQDLQYTVYFGDGVIGKKPSDGNIVITTFLTTSGEATNKLPTFVPSGNVAGYRDNVSITTVSSSYGGSEKETIEQVRFRAPYFYTTQNRAVTATDYATLLTKDYPNIDSVSAWSGDENDPPIYGKVFLALKTKENYYLTASEKEAIKENLISNRNVMTVIPELVDPDYTYILIRGDVKYNPSLTSLSATDIRSYVRATILDYETNELNRFDSTFRKSKMQNYIENAEKSITGSDIKVYLQKRVLLDRTQAKRYIIETNFPIKKGDFNNRIYSYPQITVKDTGGIDRLVFFEEVPAYFTGVDSISIINPGINYSSAPTVTITGDGSGATAVAKIASGRITSIEVTNKGSNYTRASISISGGGGSEASAEVKLESKFGKLRTYYTKSNGEKVIVNEEAGDINYETGSISISSLSTSGAVENDFYDTDILTMNLPIDKEIITPLRNRIITIDQNDPLSTQIEIISEN